MRTNKIVDATENEIENAKETAVALISDSGSNSAIDLFYTNDLDEIETGIKRLNEFSSRTWILSAILLYTLIYNRNLYQQSGLSWAEYSKESRERLGIDQRDITEQLSAARFFIKYHKSLERAGWSPNGSNRKLARAELALELSGNIDETVKHIATDTWVEFKDWYSTFKDTEKLPASTDCKREDLKIEGNRFIINGIEAITISDSISKQDKERLSGYIRQIFEAMQLGYEPAIVQVYDKKEAAVLSRLRDKYRQGK